VASSNIWSLVVCTGMESSAVQCFCEIHSVESLSKVVTNHLGRSSELEHDQNCGLKWDHSNHYSIRKRNILIVNKLLLALCSLCPMQKLIARLVVGWFSGRMLVLGRRAFTVLCSACSWWVTTYVSKPSATGNRSANQANSSFRGR